MHKLMASIQKEFLLIKRDWGGLLILFLMPVILVITITLVQRSTFRSVTGGTMQVLLVDQDHGEVTQNIREQLRTMSALTPVTHINGRAITEEQAAALVAGGTYQLAIVIPPGLSEGLHQRIQTKVKNIIKGMFNVEKNTSSPLAFSEKTLTMYFDPTTQHSFRSTVQFAVEKMVQELQTTLVYKAFQKELGASEAMQALRGDTFVKFEKINPSLRGEEVLPNAVQHNIPAWTLFAIFFLVLPLSLNMIKEKNQGTFVRLESSPLSRLTYMLGKSIIYTGVCFIQFFLILGIGVYLFPLMGLPALAVHGDLFLLLIVTFCVAVAAIGLGVLIGTLFSTQEQTAPFGAILVILLAAIGGIWVPTFAMPEFMQQLAAISPMNWGLRAYYAIFLRQASLSVILPELGTLLLFSICTMGVASWIHTKKNNC